MPAAKRIIGFPAWGPVSLRVRYLRNTIWEALSMNEKDSSYFGQSSSADVVAAFRCWSPAS
jgi:hypothetical protein